MDSLITAAARALAAGDPLGALKRVALRNDAPALALRGIAMAQLGDFLRAKELLRCAARAFTAKEAIARARCVVAEAEVALASRDLSWPPKALDAARATLEQHGDRLNAAFARYLALRRLLLMGHLDDVERMLADLSPRTVPACIENSSRTRHCGNRDASPPNEKSACRTRARRAIRTPSTHPGPVSGSRNRMAHPESPGGAPNRAGSGASLSGSKKSKRSSHRKRLSSTPAAMSCANETQSFR